MILCMGRLLLNPSRKRIMATPSYEIESWGTYTGDWFKSSLFVHCEENDRIAELEPGQTARVWFRSGAGRSLHWVERTA